MRLADEFSAVHSPFLLEVCIIIISSKSKTNSKLTFPKLYDKLKKLKYVKG